MKEDFTGISEQQEMYLPNIEIFDQISAGVLVETNFKLGTINEKPEEKKQYNLFTWIFSWLNKI